MKSVICFFLLLLLTQSAYSQSAKDSIFITVLNEKQQPLEAATIELLRATDSSLVKTALTDAKGNALLLKIATGTYTLVISYTGYATQILNNYTIPSSKKTTAVILQPGSAELANITVTARKPFIQHEQGKVLVNVDASVTNTGTSVLDVLEKSPGVTVDRNGGISLQSKTGVLVLIDGKQTFLSGTELSNLLSGMSSAQVEQIELITNPSAKYDASGNAGIINIKTKKNKQKGFNGTVTISAGQGRYPKNNNSLLLNYRNGRFNAFLTYSSNINKYYTDIYALRKYYDTNGKITAVLDQPTYFSGTVYNNTLKTGLDYYLSDKTTVGFAFTGILSLRNGHSDASARWLSPNGTADSTISTISNSKSRFTNGGLNINVKHSINKLQDISFDVDWLNYDISNEQYFSNQLLNTGGYNEAFKGVIPSQIHILSGKADHLLKIGKTGKIESGWKSSHISTDNLADYHFYNGDIWSPDYGRSNHFLYKENIHALYSSLQQEYKRFTMQVGLRYEYTSYNASQLGNAIRKDSAFSRNYDALFPSGYISWMADSAHSFTFTAGRRIDRPAFQKLNPFVSIVNKYTYQSGNPFFRPQYSWNMELSHQFKSYLTTAVSYSIIKDYFSQLFLTDSTGILYYSEGNVGRTHNIGLSVTAQITPFKWWSFTSQALLNYKKLKGYVWNNFESSVTQFNISANNQFRINENFTAELSGFYTGKARNDLQEALLPTGQLSAGISRPVLKKKGTLKLSIRDIFYTLVMEGDTKFQYADEYFILRRDSRVVNLSFTYRFGKPLKAAKRSSGGASDEIDRVGNG